jgi:betaine-aldehyde dehydrogenase
MGPSEVRKVPIGVAAGIIPWNVPLFISMLKLAPAMIAGCTMVLKPAPEAPLDSYLLAQMLTDAGLPPGVVNIVAAGREVGEYLVTHPDIDKVSFTGSTAVGRRIGALCGERLRPVTLELGGKSAAIVMEDADLETTIAGLMPNTMMNNGQACVAQTRLLAPKSRYDEIVDAASEWVGALKVGDALDAETEVGPLVAERQRERVEGYIASGREQGARVTVGGGRPAGLDRGWFVEPTVFADATNDMRIAREEIFGPVLTIIPYDGIDDAVRIANDSDYGLSGSVWGADSDAAAGVARRMRTGTTNVNTFMLDGCSPFGGFKSSGLGRELGPEGLEAYLESQSIAHVG